MSVIYLQGVLYQIVQDQEVMIGGDIILSIDDIKLTSLENYEKMMDHIDSIKSTHKHKITVLRGGEILVLYWISTD